MASSPATDEMETLVQPASRLTRRLLFLLLVRHVLREFLPGELVSSQETLRLLPVRRLAKMVSTLSAEQSPHVPIHFLRTRV